MAQEKQVVLVPDYLTVRELAELISASPIEVMKRLIANGIMASINQQVDYDVRAVNGFNGETVDALSLHARCPEFGESVGVHLLVYDHDDLRGALKPDRRGRKPRGDLGAVRALLAEA